MKHTLTTIEIIRLHDAIHADPDYKTRYEEINRKRDEEVDKLFNEFRKIYYKKLFDND